MEKISFTLNEFDLNTIDHLHKKTGLNNTAIIHHALYLCREAFKQAAKGNMAGVYYSNYNFYDHNFGSRQVSLADVAKEFNNRSARAVNKNVIMYRHPDALQSMEEIKRAAKVSDDGSAVGFALAFADKCVKTLESVDGGKKIVFSQDLNPEKAFSTVKTPFDNTVSNKCANVLRKAKNGLRGVYKSLKPS